MKLGEILKHPQVKEYSKIQGKVGIMAIHGGNIEPGTEQISNHISKLSSASLYVLSVRTHEREYERFHLSSTKIDTSESETLKEFLEHIEAAISIHGHGRRKCKNTIFLGGLNRKLRKLTEEMLKERLYYEILNEDKVPESLRGENPKNIVNLAKNHGVQIELPKKLRRNFDDVRNLKEEPKGDALIFAKTMAEVVRAYSKELKYSS
ncbi:MAG: poly-gamma-glutamate hydrolase family protein [Candidatus Methanofastidiosia archaeon]